MRLILSRKGFDSSAGGCPSAQLPDNRLVSLPIPDPHSTITYQDLEHGGVNYGELVQDLTGARLLPTDTAHLDPDLNPALLPRQRGWRPMLGQTGAAQGHLRNQGVGPGDLFLFFGVYHEVAKTNERWHFRKDRRPEHILWGWLQVEGVAAVDQLDTEAMPWARYHPHFQYGPDANNTLYIATRKLHIPGLNTNLPGAGTFSHRRVDRVLTAPGARRPSTWRLPGCFHPNTGASLSYHSAANRWAFDEAFCQLQSAYRGQEFVLSGMEENALYRWLSDLFSGVSDESD